MLSATLYHIQLEPSLRDGHNATRSSRISDLGSHPCRVQEVTNLHVRSSFPFEPKFVMLPLMLRIVHQTRHISETHFINDPSPSILPSTSGHLNLKVKVA